MFEAAGYSGELLKIYIIAGESSGDLLGAHLMRSLKEQTTRPIMFFGVGGPRMIAEGLTSLFPFYELSRLGFVEILPYIFNLTARIHETVDDIQTKDPDMVITIDCPGFCYRVVKKLRKEQHSSLFVHYVAPTVWAYKPDRAEKCAEIFHHLLVLLPFEPPYFKQAKLPCTYVGHAVVAESKEGNGAAFRAKFDIAEDVPLFCVLPGSRLGEVKKLMPIFAKMLTFIAPEYPNLALVVAVPENMITHVAPFFENCPFRAVILSNDEDKKNAFSAAKLAVVKSGTVSLEVAMAGTPMLVTYRVHPISAWIFKRMAMVKYVTLINILSKREVVPELLQSLCTPFMLANAALALLQSPERMERQIVLQNSALAMLVPEDGQPPSDKAARKIFELFRKWEQKKPMK